MRYDPHNQSIKQPFAVIPPAAQPEGKNRRILRVFWWTLPLAGVALVLGVWLVGLAIWAEAKASSANKGNWDTAASSYQSRVLQSPLSPENWLTDYNAGTALLHLGEVDEGIARLEEAFEGVPKAVPDDFGALQPYSYECQVRMNISAGLELQGDEQGSSNKESAIELYEEALEWVGPCQIGGAGDGEPEDESGEGDSGEGGADEGGPDEGGEGGEDGEPSDQFGAEPMNEGNPGGEATDRLEEKIRDLEKGDENEEPSAPGENGGEQEAEIGFGNETDSEREKREELEQKNQDQQERQREKEEKENRNPGTGGW